MREQEAFPFFHPPLRAGAQTLGTQIMAGGMGANVLNVVKPEIAWMRNEPGRLLGK